MKYPKTITSLICLLSLLLSGALATVGAQDSLRIWLSSEIAQATAGQEFVVTVNVTGANQVYGGSFQLLYDPQVFEVILVDNQAVSPGAFFGSEPSFALKNMVDATTGTVDYALTLTQPAVPVTGEGMLGTVKFRALQDAPVVITPAGAQLVSPEFTEVDGRLVAQKINQVDAQVSDMVVGGIPLAAPQSAESIVADSASASVSVSVAPPSDVSSSSVSVDAQIPPLTEERRSMPNNKMLIVAGLFFVGGLMLLTVSVGMYSKMRVGLSFAGEFPPEQPL